MRDLLIESLGFVCRTGPRVELGQRRALFVALEYRLERCLVSELLIGNEDASLFLVCLIFYFCRLSESRLLFSIKHLSRLNLDS